jgi:hypothetical protein
MFIATYGCSYTSYIYPTYATILGCEHNVKNRAKSGVGNDWIFYKIMEDVKSGFIKNFDLVVVQWTGFTRWNYLTEKGWIGMDGSVLNPVNPDSRRTYKKIKSFYNIDYERQRFINYYHVIQNILQEKLFVLSYEKTDLDFVNIDNLHDEYKGDYQFTAYDKDHFLNEPWVDEHPTLLQHLEIARKILPLNETTEKRVTMCDKKIRKTQEFKLITCL